MVDRLHQRAGAMSPALKTVLKHLMTYSDAN